MPAKYGRKRVGKARRTVMTNAKRDALVAAIRALADEIRSLDGAGSHVPAMLIAASELLGTGPMDHVSLIRAMLDDGRFLA